MFIKRALFTWRNWKLMLLQILVILVFTTYLLRTSYPHYDLPTRELDLSQYGQTIVPYSVSGNSDLTLNFINNLKIFLNVTIKNFGKCKVRPIGGKKRDCCYMKIHLYYLERRDLTMLFSYPFLSFPTNYQYLRGS